jgi:hypothetical protein
VIAGGRGARDDLEAAGVTVDLNYVTNLAGNVSGGMRRGSGYAGFAVAGGLAAMGCAERPRIRIGLWDGRAVLLPA